MDSASAVQIQLLDLPADVLRRVIDLLPTIQERARLLCCVCRRLQVFGEAEVWPQLRALELEVRGIQAAHEAGASLAAWAVARLRTTLRCLRVVVGIDHPDHRDTLASIRRGRQLLEAMSSGGGGRLASLAVAATRPTRWPWDAPPWHLDELLPRLRFLAAPAQPALVLSLPRLSHLTALKLDFTDVPRGPDPLPALPASLRALELATVHSLPPAVAAATQLRSLALLNDNLDPEELPWEGVDLEGLGRLSLTALTLRNCVLPAVPVQLAAMSALACLDLTNNYLGRPGPELAGDLAHLLPLRLAHAGPRHDGSDEGQQEAGEAGEVAEERAMSAALAPLAAVTANLQDLHLASAFWQGRKEAAGPALPLEDAGRLRVLNLTRNRDALATLLLRPGACASLEVLACDLPAAAASGAALEQLTSLRQLHLTYPWLTPNERRSAQHPWRDLPARLYAVLRGLPCLGRVVVQERLAEAVGGYHVALPQRPYGVACPERDAAVWGALQEWRRLLPGKEVVLARAGGGDATGGAAEAGLPCMGRMLQWDEVAEE